MNPCSTPTKGKHECGGRRRDQQFSQKQREVGLWSHILWRYRGFLWFGEEDLQQAKEQYPSIVLEAQQLLGYGADKEGWPWVSASWSKLNNATDIVDVKYGGSGYTVVWLFHQSSCHHNYINFLVILSKILVKDGGTRRVWVTNDHRPWQWDSKGLRTTLRECGIKMTCILSYQTMTASWREDYSRTTPQWLRLLCLLFTKILHVYRKSVPSSKSILLSTHKRYSIETSTILNPLTQYQ